MGVKETLQAYIKATNTHQLEQVKTLLNENAINKKETTSNSGSFKNGGEINTHTN